MLVAFVVGMVALERPAEAQVYKYEKKDGTVVYTDKLSDLPAEKRRYYAKKEAEARKAREEADAHLTPAERRRQEIEREQAALKAEQLAEAERLQRQRRLDQLLARLNEESAREADQKAYWKERVADARKRLDEALAAFHTAQEEWRQAALRNNGYALPGAMKRQMEAHERVEKAEAEVDAANEDLTVTIPAEARKAGVPPGWVR